ncbi:MULTISPECIES: heme ABC transporter substrate-binding protein IsdE [Mammaliicoccus]|uniref:heme ABC transporter substrate-binding protein IsdE n=1 Tax=Mammaliicoccus TaxID=2803850 RepID=UPI00065B481C|nr:MULTISPECIES: heme ABC transporter substrate-binding protein IsdE [Mammaliicoccus]MBO1219396.1 heme ABC transporter substrate-binding protein IsdE [Mammaliicoccus sciuri]MBO1233065.1 heme ABC transporter substrate-binding protein IsdE [Mammaliicoccus sciuri]PNY91288.1 heme ABC transporter substrate-binding protein IsdE [Mammaliicoccus sciuri]PTJ82080.1 heme ABC transporter substrate-binding protein IsdE [Mammaliicoccus sciuri]PTK16591.1 heme ABC transporter substrate-binding protein IsdE [M
MKIKSLLILMIICSCLLAACNINFSKSSEPSSKQKKEEFRIVPTTVALTETLDALDLDIVGKPTTYKDLPKRYKDVPEIGQPKKPNVEVVKSLNPTHVLTVTTIKSEMDPVFEQLKMKGTYYDYDSLNGLKKSITEMGNTFNRKEQAKKLNKKFDNAEAEIKAKIQGKKRPKVLILMGVPGSYLVATEHSYIGDLVKIAGGENVIQNESRAYLASNTEELYKVNPDIILRLPHGFPDQVREMFKKEFSTNDIWKHFDAVKNNRVYDLEEIPFGITASIKADDALVQLYDILYHK